MSYQLLEKHAPANTPTPYPEPLVEAQLDPYLSTQGDEGFEGLPLASAMSMPSSNKHTVREKRPSLESFFGIQLSGEVCEA